MGGSPQRLVSALLGAFMTARLIGLKCSYDYTDNCRDDAKSLSFSNFFFQEITASVMVTIDKAEAIGVINIACPIVNP